MLHGLKSTIRNFVRQFGYDIVPLRDFKDRDFAIHLSQVLRKLEIDCVIDVGANTGQYHDFLRDKVGYRGLILSVEPVQRNIDILERRAAEDPYWHILGHALGRSRGELPIKVMKSDQFSSFLAPDNRAIPSFNGLNEPEHVEIVQVHTLDAILPDLRALHGFHRPYLKLDTQGFDLEVLAGAAESLPQVWALQSEASIIGIYQGMPNYVETIQALNERGFEISGLYPVSRDPALRLVEFDCVTINRRFIPPVAAA